MVRMADLSPLIPSLSVKLQTSLLEDAGFCIDPLLRSAGLTRADLEGPDLLIAGSQELAVQRGFAHLTRDRPDLWVAASLRYRLFTYYPLGFAMVTAPSLAELLTVLLRLGHLHYGLMYFELIEDADGNPGLETHYADSLDDLKSFLLCREAIAFTTSLHELWGGHFPFLRIETASRLPAEYGFDYKAPCIQSDGPARWYWRRSVMDEAPAFADPLLHSIYLSQCEALAAQRSAAPTEPDLMDRDDPLMIRILNAMNESGRFDWTLDQLAADLSMSRRSLQRKLTYRGITFRSLVEEHRCSAAKRLLRKSGKSIAEVAWQLGYADASSFHQAFVRWTHRSPSAFRKDG